MSIKISHEDYLKNILYSAKLTLKELEILHRINIAVYEGKKEILYKQIESIEKQLENTK